MKYLFIILMVPFLFGANWPDMSIYQLDGTWQNHEAKDMKLEKLSGEPALVAMVFTSCKHACPMITSKMRKIRTQLPKKLQDNMKYALISFDPKGDTPAVLKAYKEKHKLDDNWVLLTSNDLQARKLAGVLGVNYKSMPEGDFSHSNIISLLDKKGVVVSQVENLNQDIGNIVKKAKQLLK